MEKEIDQKLYSRQIRTYGLKIMKKLVKLKYLVVGIGGLGFEIAKNLILAGPNEVNLFDDKLVNINDLGSNLYIEEVNIGKIRRDKACEKKFSELNPYVKVKTLEKFEINDCLYYDVIIITEIMFSSDILFLINEKMREKNKGFIFCANLGLSAFGFSDFGRHFQILDEDGQELSIFYINDISVKENKLIMEIDISNTSKRLKSQTYIKFKDVEGMIELNKFDYLKVSKIDSKENSETFEIQCDFSGFKNYIKGGIVQEIKIPINKAYKSLKENYQYPVYNYDDFDKTPEKNKRYIVLHSFILSIQKFFDEKKCLPKLNDEEESKIILKNFKNFFKVEKNDENPPFYDDKLIFDLAKWSKANIPSICSFLGGIMAQEAIKFTGIYTPLDQFIFVDFYETTKYLENPDRILLNSKYDEQIAIYGKQILEKLKNLKIFMIGAGAVGCEYLKILSLMGIATGEKGKLIITDNDNIETSNLNRQFLFRNSDIGKSKSKVACDYIKKFNPNINCCDLQLRVCKETEDFFNQEFWVSQDIILIAVDNREARKYIFNKCVVFDKIMINCGTEGEKASSQLIIPNITSGLEYEEENNQGMAKSCTIKQFPSLIEHCIEWGREKFTEYFIKNINDCKLILIDFENFGKSENEISLNEIYKNTKVLLEIKEKNTFDECVRKAINQYKINYILNIQQILENYPEDKKDENGLSFWRGSNKRPNIVPFNLNDCLCYDFVFNYSLILARILDIKIPENPKLFILNFSDSFISEKMNVKNISNTILKQEIKNLIEKFKKKFNKESINPEEFEKDNDANNQIDFIYSCSNLRARNYRIFECNKEKTRFIAGKIVPSIATSSASITGFISTQIYTLLQTNDRKILKEINLNLSTPFIQIYRPERLSFKKDRVIRGQKFIVIPKKTTIWTKIEIKGSLTIQEFVDKVEKDYGIEICYLYDLNNNSLLNEDNLRMKVEEVYYHDEYKIEKNKKNPIFLTVSATIDDDIADLPIFKYIYN